MMKAKRYITDAVVLIWITLLFVLFWGDPDLSDRLLDHYLGPVPAQEGAS